MSWCCGCSGRRRPRAHPQSHPRPIAERRDEAKPGGARSGHEGHSRAMSPDVDRFVDHQPDQCPCCRARLATDLPAWTVSEHDTIELPAIKPWIERHRRLAVRCPSCGTQVVAPVPDAAKGTPFGPRVHAVATYSRPFRSCPTSGCNARSRSVRDHRQPGRPDEHAAQDALRSIVTRPSRRCARPRSSRAM